MKITLVVANYNNGEFFSSCYESIVNQTIEDFEVIIIDDASTDSSVEIISELIKNDKRFRLFENPSNKGYAFSLDRGFRLATTTLLARVDPDDSLAPEALEKIIEEFTNQPKWAAVYSQCWFCDENLKPIKIFERAGEFDSQSDLFFNIENKIHHFFAFKQKNYIECGGIDTFVRRAVDQNLYLNLLTTGEFKFLPIPLYYYRYHSLGISAMKNKPKAKLWHIYSIFSIAKKRGLNPEEIILRDMLGQSELKQKFHGSLFYRASFKLFRLMNGSK